MLNHKIYGQGDPIIILHGLFGMLDNWQSIAKKLATDYMVILVDQRDHGKSDHTDSFSYSLLADDLNEFMNDHWIHSAHILGHSMGGKTAMQFANDYPEMVEKLIIIDIAPKEYPPGHRLIFKALRSVPIDKVKSRKDVEDILKKYIDNIGIRLFLMKNLKRKKEGGFEWKMNLELLHDAYPNILKSLNIEGTIDCDTLLVYGANSNYIKENDVKDINNIFQNSTFKKLNAGHWIHAEKPKELEEEIRRFLLS